MEDDSFIPSELDKELAAVKAACSSNLNDATSESFSELSKDQDTQMVDRIAQLISTLKPMVDRLTSAAALSASSSERGSVSGSPMQSQDQQDQQDEEMEDATSLASLATLNNIKDLPQMIILSDILARLKKFELDIRQAAELKQHLEEELKSLKNRAEHSKDNIQQIELLQASLKSNGSLNVHSDDEEIMTFASLAEKFVKLRLKLQQHLQSIDTKISSYATALSSSSPEGVDREHSHASSIEGVTVDLESFTKPLINTVSLLIAQTHLADKVLSLSPIMAEKLSSLEQTSEAQTPLSIVEQAQRFADSDPELQALLDAVKNVENNQTPSVKVFLEDLKGMIKISFTNVRERLGNLNRSDSAVNLQDTESALATKIQDQENELLRRQERIGELENALKVKHDDNTSLHSTLNELQQRFESITENANQKETVIESLSAQLHSAEQSRNAKESEWKSSLEAKDAQIASLEQQVASLRDKLVETEEVVRTHTSEKESLKVSYEEQLIHANLKNTSYVAFINRLVDLVKNKTPEIDELDLLPCISGEDDVDAFETLYTLVSARLSQASASETDKATIESQSSEIESLKSRLAQVESENAAMASGMESYQSEVDTWSAEMAQKLQTAEERIAELTAATTASNANVELNANNDGLASQELVDDDGNGDLVTAEDTDMLVTIDEPTDAADKAEYLDMPISIAIENSDMPSPVAEDSLMIVDEKSEVNLDEPQFKEESDDEGFKTPVKDEPIIATQQSIALGDDEDMNYEARIQELQQHLYQVEYEFTVLKSEKEINDNERVELENRKRELEEQMATMNEKLEVTVNEMNSLRAKYEAAMDTTNKLTEQMSKVAENNQGSSQLSETDFLELKQKLTEAESNQALLQEKLTNTEENARKLEDTLGELQFRLADHALKRNQLSREIDDLKITVAEKEAIEHAVRAELQNVNAQFEETVNELMELKAISATKAEEFNAQVSVTKDLESRIAQKEMEEEALRSELQAVNVQLDETVNELMELKAMNVTQAAAFEQQITQTKELETKILQKESVADSLRAELQAANAQLDDTVNELMELKALHASKTRDLSEALKTSEAELETQTELVTKLKSELQAVSDELSIERDHHKEQMQQHVEEHEQTLEAMRKLEYEIAHRTQQAETLTMDINEARYRIEEYMKTNETLSRSLNEKSSNLEQCQMLLNDRLLPALRSLKEQKAQLETGFQALSGFVVHNVQILSQGMNAASSEWETQVTSAQAQYAQAVQVHQEKLQALSRSYEQDMDAAQKEIADKTTENKSLNDTVAQNDVTIQELTKELNVLQEAVRRTQDEINIKEDRLRESQKSIDNNKIENEKLNLEIGELKVAMLEQEQKLVDKNEELESRLTSQIEEWKQRSTEAEKALMNTHIIIASQKEAVEKLERDQKDYQSRTEEMMKEIRDKEELLELERAQLHKARDELLTLTKTHEALLVAKNELAENFNAIKENFDALAESKTKLLQEYSELEKEKVQAELRMLELETARNEMQDELESKVSQLGMYSQHRQEWEQQLEDAMKQLDNEANRRTEYDQTIERLTGQIAEKEEQLRLVTTSLETKEANVSLLMQEKEALRSNVSDLQAELAARENQVDAMRQEVTDLKSKLSSMSAEMSSNQLDIKDIREQLERRDVEVAALERDINSAQQKQIEMDDVLSNLQSENSRYKEEIVAKSLETESVNSMLLETKERIVSLETQIKQHEMDQEGLQTNLLQKSTELETAQSRIQELESRSKETENIIANLTTSIEEKRVQLKTLEEELTTTTTVSQRTQQAHALLQAQHGELQEQFGQQKQIIDLLEHEMEKATQVHTEKVRGVTEELNASKAQHKKLVDKLVVAEKLVRDLEQRRDYLSKQVEELQSQLSSSKKRRSHALESTDAKDENARMEVENTPRLSRTSKSDSRTPTPKRHKAENHGSTMQLTGVSSNPVPACGEQTPSPQTMVISFSGFRDSVPKYSNQVKEKLMALARSLGASIHTDSDNFDAKITHIIAPPRSKTLKTFAAALMSRWIITDLSWIHDSAAAGRWLDESKYGHRNRTNPFKGRKFYLAPTFVAESKNTPGKAFRMKYCEQLVQMMGQGEIVQSPAGADYVVVGTGDKERYPSGRVLAWQSFIDLIPIPGTPAPPRTR